MKPEKREEVETVANKELFCELHGIPVRLPPDAKYKRRDHHDKPTGPILTVGKKAVLALDRRDRIGYYLAVLVDWDDEAVGFWTMGTTMYFVVLDKSNSKMPDRIGRIVSASQYKWGLHILSWNEDDFKKI